MRTGNVIKNILSSWSGQICILISSLLLRRVLARTLPVEYLGISNLFTNILSILSFADLGLDLSVSHYLYEPLAQNDKKRITAAVRYYKRIYFGVGCVVFTAGMLFMPFLHLLIGDCDIPHIRLIYFLYILNTAVSYFNTHKITLITADQKLYIVTVYANVIKVVQTVLGIFVLVYTKAYIPYYLLQVLATVLLNVLISIKADRMYPYLKEIRKDKYTTQYLSVKKEISRNMPAMVMHKMAAVVVNGTDNVLLSVFAGLASVGLYSNYAALIVNISSIFSSLYYSMAASVGNYAASESSEKKTQLFYTLLFSEFWIFGFGAICLFNLCSPFVNLWLGKDFLLGDGVLFILCLNFYLQGMRRVILAFRDAEGLFDQDKYKAVLEALINLAASVYLARRFGMIGVFAGTTVSLITTCAWLEPLILFRYCLLGGMKRYFAGYLRYLAEVLAVGAVTCLICGRLGDTIAMFAVKALVCVAVPNACFFILHRKSREFGELCARVSSAAKKLCCSFKCTRESSTPISK